MPSVPPPTKATTKTQSVSTHLPTESVTEKPKSLDKDATVVKVMTKYLGMPLKEFRKSRKIYDARSLVPDINVARKC